jgi:formylmethanofuran dehydrogenase subunit C
MTGGHIISIGDYAVDYLYGDDMGFGRRMKGGKIRLEGNLKNMRAPREQAPFSEMSGGEVEILGNVKSNWSFIGHKMTAGTVRIHGDCDDIGERMIGGIVEVDGNARSVGTYMRGGTIRVRGDATSVGSEMEGGKIVVDGSCKSGVGKRMRGSSEIHVKKDVGDPGHRGNVGYEINGGHILIDGDVLGEIGCEMRGGKIHVRGSNLEKERSVGLYMSSGEITIDGDALSGAGDRMKGGTIHVNGSMKQANYVRFGGQVYHRGQVVRDTLGAKLIKRIQGFIDRH